MYIEKKQTDIFGERDAVKTEFLKLLNSVLFMNFNLSFGYFHILLNGFNQLDSVSK